MHWANQIQGTAAHSCLLSYEYGKFGFLSLPLDDLALPAGMSVDSLRLL